MTRRRVAVAIVVGVLLGFFAGVAAVTLGRDAGRRAIPPDAGAARVSAATSLSTMYGAKQASTHLALVRTAPVVPFIRRLSLGSSDRVDHGTGAVTELQRALRRSGVRPRPLVSGFFGLGTQAAVRAFQRAHHVRPASGVYGRRTHHALARYYDVSSRRVLQAVAHTRTILQKYQRVTRATAYAWLHRSQMAYSQGPSRAFLPLLPGFPRATDCSGYATWVYKVSGLPDPSGFAYRIVGYTGTLAEHGTRISANAALHVGDLVFYGGGWPYGHVAIIVDAFRRLVSSHGSPGIGVLPFNYRPVSAVRRYF